MGAAKVRSRRGSLLSLFVLGGLLGCGGISCKREPTGDIGPMPSGVRAKPAPQEQAKAAVPPSLRSLLLSRRFAAATQAIERLPQEEQSRPEVRLAAAFAAWKTGAGERALVALQGLETELGPLTSDIRELRARAQLTTQEAMQGAEALSQLGERDAWVLASESLERQGHTELALESSSRGLAQESLRKNSGGDVRRLRLHTLRARLLASDPARPEYRDELRWLSAASATSAEAERLLEAAVASGKLALTASDRRKRLLRLAEQGLMDELERELVAVAAKGLVRLGKAESSYLRGRVRLLSRRDQRAGARFLSVAAELGHPNATQLRFDAARMLVREGDAPGACRLYDQIAGRERSRAEEALYYAARAQAVLGDPKEADHRYARLAVRFPKGKFADDARYERTLNWLVIGKPRDAQSGLRVLLDDPRFREKRATLLHLSAIASEETDSHEDVLARYREVVAAYPLHPAGLFARTRLAAAGDKTSFRTPPPAKEPVALDATLMPRTTLLLTMGLDELAARALREEERALSQVAREGRRAQCAAWSAVGYGARGYAISSDLREQVQLATEASRLNRWAFDCRFPTPYVTLVQEFERQSGLPSALVHAVMRQESGFDPAIVSPANARGLLQLLPETAERVRNELATGAEVEIAPSLDLSEPRINLELGTAYLGKLLGVFDGNLVLAIASYNAGPRSVAQWVSKANGMSAELFAARIPYAETRGYVERVLSNLAMYRYLAEGDAGLPTMPMQLPKQLELSDNLY